MEISIIKLDNEKKHETEIKPKKESPWGNTPEERFRKIFPEK